MKKILTSIIGSLVFLALLSLDPVHLQRNDQDLAGLKLDGFGTAIQKGFAATTNSGVWEYVRNTATFVRNITISINTILTEVNSSQLVKAATYKGQAGEFKIVWNNNDSVTIMRGNDGALLGSMTYTKSLRIFNNSEQMLVEMYFNSGDGGLLVRWMPGRINPTLYQSGGMGECQLSGASGSRTMICSFSGGPFLQTPPTPDCATAIIKAQESGGKISVAALSKNFTNFQPGGGALPSCDAADIYYFPLAYVVKNSSPYNTTGKFGFNKSGIASTICGGAYPNIFNYGLFSINANPTATDMQKYFYQDGVLAANIPSEYPTAAEVDALFSTIAPGGSGDGVISIDVLNSLVLAFKNSVY